MNYRQFELIIQLQKYEFYLLLGIINKLMVKLRLQDRVLGIKNDSSRFTHLTRSCIGSLSTSVKVASGRALCISRIFLNIEIAPSMLVRR